MAGNRRSTAMTITLQAGYPWGRRSAAHILPTTAMAEAWRAFGLENKRAVPTGMAEQTDEQLMAAVATGDQRAFRTLADRHVGRAIGLARRLTGNLADAEDVAQEALLRTWTQAPRWQPRAAFRTWLYRVVVNLAIDKRRKRPFVDLEAAGDPADPTPQAAEKMESDETSAKVREAIAALPERQRTALVLTHYEGMSNQDAADIVGTSVGGLESLLVRARRSLRDALGELRN
jgi:RNA polymerase sigma-70 factor (ECF subfamily)